jgi:hypothetical protein
MATKVRQVAPVDVWPSGGAWTVGLLELTPAQLAERFALDFESGSDDLDGYKLAAVGEPQVGQFWLFSHDRTPVPGTEVMVDMATDRETALASVWLALRLDTRAFSWVSPYATCPPADPSEAWPMSKPPA